MVLCCVSCLPRARRERQVSRAAEPNRAPMVALMCCPYLHGSTLTLPLLQSVLPVESVQATQISLDPGVLALLCVTERGAWPIVVKG